MSVIATIKEINGVFYAKDIQGNVRELKYSDNILLNEIVYASKYNNKTLN